MANLGTLGERPSRELPPEGYAAGRIYSQASLVVCEPAKTRSALNLATALLCAGLRSQRLPASTKLPRKYSRRAGEIGIDHGHSLGLYEIRLVYGTPARRAPSETSRRRRAAAAEPAALKPYDGDGRKSAGAAGLGTRPAVAGTDPVATKGGPDPHADWSDGHARAAAHVFSRRFDALPAALRDARGPVPARDGGAAAATTQF